MVLRLSSSSFAFCAALVAVNLAVAAAESSIQPTENSIEAAKRDFQAIKGRGAVPEGQIPLKLQRRLPPLEMDTGENPRVPSPIQRARQIESGKTEGAVRQSKTWLIDAMRKAEKSPSDKAVRSDSPGAQGESGLSMLEDLDEGMDQETIDDRSNVDPASDRTTATSARGQIGNPLDAYMSKWMTPRDFELLKSTPEHPVRGAGPSALSRPLIPVHTTGSSSTQFDHLRTIFEPPQSFSGSKNENPYVTGLIMPPSDVPDFVMKVPTGRVSPSLMPSVQQKSPIIERTEVPSAQPSTGELLKPTDDARYFKQLKRF